MLRPGARPVHAIRLPRSAGGDRGGQGRRHPCRDLVRRRGQGRAEEQDHAPLGEARHTARSPQRPENRLGLHLRRHLPSHGQRSRACPAALHHGGHDLAPERDRAGGHTRGACPRLGGSGGLASVEAAPGPRPHHPRAAPFQGSRVEPGREHLAVHAGELDLEPDLRLLQRHPRPLLRGVEQAHRSALAHHVHRTARLGSPVLINGTWYNSAVSALRFFFSVTVDRPAVTKPLTFVAEPRKIPIVLSLEEVVRFLEAAPGPKYKAALSAAYGAGLRVSEVVALKVSDVDSKRMLLRIEQGKGRRDRFAMLSPQLLELLRDWWRIARPQVWLFPGQNAVNPLTPRQFNRAVHAAAQRAKITKRVTPHTLRHSFATHLLEQNIDIRVIQVLLGHAKLETTALYTRVAANTIRMVMSPLDRLTPLRLKPDEPPA